MSNTGRTNRGAAKTTAKAGGGRGISRGERERMGRATVPGFVKQTIIAGRLPEGGEALAVVMALVNLGAVERGIGVSAKAICRETDGRVCEEEVMRICRTFVAGEFAILEEDDARGCDIQTRRFYLTTDHEVIATAAMILRGNAYHLLGRADLLAKAADASKKSVPFWMGSPDTASPKSAAEAEAA